MTLNWQAREGRRCAGIDDENPGDLDTLAACTQPLDEVEASSGPRARAGVDRRGQVLLQWFSFSPATPTRCARPSMSCTGTLARLFLFPAYTVAALNGHTFAAGALFSCGFDYRVMRADRGYWCMNEVDIGLALDERLAAILFARLPREVVVDAIVTGHRFTGLEALAAGIVQEATDEDALVARALEVAGAMAAKDRVVIGAHKRLGVSIDVAARLGHPVT